MKRTAAAALILLFCFTAALSAEAEETRRYLIATRAVGGMKAALQATPGDVQPRRSAEFRTFRGFAADLTEAEAAALRRSGEVRWIEPVIERYAFETRNHAGQTTPYGINLVGAPSAWQGRRSGTINVVVADSGVDFLHPDLAPLWAGGTNVLSVGGSPMDDNGHGTHVAGIIAASDNQYGVVGVAGVSGVRLWGAKVLNSAGKGTSESVIKSLDWVVKQKETLGGQWVVNFSLGAAGQSFGESEAIRKASEAGILIIAATGNDSTSTQVAPVSYPAAHPDVVAVGAVDRNSIIASFSNQGPEVDVVAPGVSVLSTFRVGKGAIATAKFADGIRDARPIEGSKLETVSGPFVFCGLGKTGEFPASVAGKIALIQRGEIRFSEKTFNARQAGAIAVAVFNNVDGEFETWTLLNDDEPQWANVSWPLALALSKADGEALKAQAGDVELSYRADDYVELSGTSMSTPHVAGAAALLWTISPTATAEEITQILKGTAKDLGTPGSDAVFGTGLIDVNAAARQLAPAAFETDVEPQYPSTGRRILRRGGRG